ARHQWLDHAALPGARRFRDLDRAGPAGGGDAGRARAGRGGASHLVNHLPFALAWAVVGGVAGVGLNYLSRWLARVEEIEFRQSGLEAWLMPALSALLFFLFALQLGIQPLLFIDSVYVAILVQVLAFDLKTRYILDLIMFPSWVIAFALAFVTPWTPALTWPWRDWRTAPVAALIAGGVFFLLYFGGQAVFGAEAFGFGDVKLAVFIGMATGGSNLL